MKPPAYRPYSEVWADRVLAVRKKLGLTQEQLADELDVSFATINRWENARCRRVRRAQMKAVRWLEEKVERSAKSAKQKTTRRKRRSEDIAAWQALNAKLSELLIGLREVQRGIEAVRQELKI